ncbi:MAG: hypothetical protein H0T62_04470 [Parachlamydiaceae bacterium]|nr:hypothetical protein [Parachlamydiaceae bacterium]
MKKLEQKIEIGSYGESELAALIRNMTPEEIQEYASQMNLGQITTISPLLTEVAEPQWKLKLTGLFQGITAVEALEALGSTLTLEQLLELLDFSTVNKEQVWKLFPIFVAIPHQLFSELLFEIPEKRKHQLQQLCVTEPLQHHLILFVHEVKRLFDQIQNRFLEQKQKIRILKVLELEPQEFENLKSEFVEFQQSIHKICCKIENALSLAWNAHSSDLVEVLSGYRERYERFLFSVIGQPSSQFVRASGLYLELEEHLSSVFDTDQDEFDALDDKEPAIEALSRFSVWYVEDYWKLGLLPKVTDPNALALPLLGGDAELLQHYRQEVEDNLNAIGLRTVYDLKQNHLVSKSLLHHYILRKLKQV